MSDDLPTLFESGVAYYFREFGHRRSREVPHQTWLMMSVARFISPQLIVAELQLPNQDLASLGELPASLGALNFDFAVTRSEIDMRTWKSRTPGWNRGVPTLPQTLQTLAEVAVIAEFKIAKSTSTTTESLSRDLKKLRATIRFLDHHGCTSFPSCYYVIHDSDRILDIDSATELVRVGWPEIAPFPKILAGPELATNAKDALA
jgi:hypothetical protein